MLTDCLAPLDQVLCGLDTETLCLTTCRRHRERLLRRPFLTGSFIKNNSPMGLSENINFIAQRARGKYLLFLNPDTTYPIRQHRRRARHLDQHLDAALLTCQLVNEDDHSTELPTVSHVAGYCQPRARADHCAWHPRFIDPA